MTEDEIEEIERLVRGCKDDIELPVMTCNMSDAVLICNGKKWITSLIAEVRRLRDLLVMSNVDPWEEK